MSKFLFSETYKGKNMLERKPLVGENQTNTNQENANKTDGLFPVIEPWPESVNGANLLNEIWAILNRYLSLPDGASIAIATWILHTYAMDCFEFTPRLCIISPEKRCGKTTLLSLIECLSYKVINVSNITAAAMFRAVEKWRPTLLIDEADSFLVGNESLRGIINAGFQKDGKIIRAEQAGKTYEPRPFKCFAPCAIAGIGRMPTTILDRSIVITMERKAKSDNKETFRVRDVKQAAHDIQRKCLRFMMDNADIISNTKSPVTEHLDDRARDLWEPMFIIAQVISPQGLESVKKASYSLAFAQLRMNEESDGTRLLKDLRNIFNTTDVEYQSSDKLVELLNTIDTSPWGGLNGGRGLNVQGLAAKLKYFKIQPHQKRELDIRKRGYNRADFKDAFERYL